MLEPKVNLILTVQGAGLKSDLECALNPEESYENHSFLIKKLVRKGKNKEIKIERFHYKTRKNKTIKYSISISKEAYEYMLNNPPTSKIPKYKWVTLFEQDRLKAHFDRIAHDKRAIKYTYSILED